MKNEHFTITRDQNGIPHIVAQTETDLYRAQGYVHARDRSMQMLLMRILGQGRASELLDSSDEMLAIDIFFRRMNWSTLEVEKQLSLLTEHSTEMLEAYCDGVNLALKEKYPWEFKLLKVKHEPWQPGDTILISRMIGYLTLTQSQAEVERLFIEMVQANIDPALLKELFGTIINGADFELIKQIKLAHHSVPVALWQSGAVRAMASNNWVVSGKKTANKTPLLANDPHLETNRLPNVWSEIVMQLNDRYIMGGSMPGAPGVMVGRNNKLSWGATYTFMDSVDSWIEQCKMGRYRKTKSWKLFKKREEIIKRKGKPDHKEVFYENEHGTLEGDPDSEGYYLTTRWSASDSGAKTINALIQMLHIDDVKTGMKTLGNVETSWNFIFADSGGNIGYQMTGLLPKRKAGNSGFIPQPGWVAANDWKSYHKPEELPRTYNPKDGFVVTANHDLNKLGKAKPINMPMGDYRASRISSLLKAGSSFTSEDFQKMHYDFYSIQAEKFMKILKPLLADDENSRLLKKWDFTYKTDSKAAWLFENFYRELFDIVFGSNNLGEKVVKHLQAETGIFIDFYQNFDKILLKKNSKWFQGKSREELYLMALEKIKRLEARPWAVNQQMTLRHIIFGGKLPKFLGFDRGPVALPGGRATIHQGQLYRAAGRETSFAPSFRFVADLNETGIVSNLAGGPSDRRFSKWYASDLENWQSGIYKTVELENPEHTLPFK